jgi:hypothetical protein
MEKLRISFGIVHPGINLELFILSQNIGKKGIEYIIIERAVFLCYCFKLPIYEMSRLEPQALSEHRQAAERLNAHT